MTPLKMKLSNKEYRRNIMVNRNNISILGCLVLTVLLFTVVNGYSASIKDRMVARQPAINKLKDQGLVGENNKGLLQFRTDKKVKQEIIQNENKDRKTVYGAIARKQGVKPGLVGQRRAKQIAEKGSPGQWFQSPDGKWYKK